MNDQERLQDIKKDFDLWSEWAVNTHFAELDVEDVEKIGWLIKQAERAREIGIYESAASEMNNILAEPNAENLALRERVQELEKALEEISDSDPRLIRNVADSSLVAIEEHIKCVEVADKALRGESE